MNKGFIIMKQYRTIIWVAVMAVITMSLGISCSSGNENNEESQETPVAPSEETEISEVSDIMDSGCLGHARTRSSSHQYLVMTKEDGIISCEVQNFPANCGTRDFDVSSKYRKGKDKPDSLFINIKPILSSEDMKDCYCPFNVYFIIRNVEADSFFLQCGDYTGMVSFKESNQVTLEVEFEW